MTEQDLLRRVEEQAVEIAELKKKMADLQLVIAGFPQRAEDLTTNLLRRMADGAANCNGGNGGSGCSYARRLL